MTTITITGLSAKATIHDAKGKEVAAGQIDLADDDVLTIAAPGAWQALVCNESPAGALSVETIIHDDDQPYEAHHLKPHGGWPSGGWSVVLVGDPGDRATVRALPASNEATTMQQ